MFDEEFSIYDSVSADRLEDKDQIILDGNRVILKSVIDNGDRIEVSGYYFEDEEEFESELLDPDALIDLWL